MSTTTKAALMSANEALTAQLRQLDLEIEVLQAKLGESEATVRELCAELQSVANTASAANLARKARPEYIMPAWQVERQEQMAAAKAVAMAHHCVVKV